MREPAVCLLARCREGDPQAFAQLAAEQQTYIYNLAYRLLRDAEEAKDLAQEALIRAWQMLPSFRGEARFTTWLYRLVVNLGLNRLTRLRRRPEQPSVDDARWPDPSSLAADPEAIHGAREWREAIWREVDALPEKYRLAIVLYYQHERSYDEIARILELPLNTVKTHLARARRMLAGRLAGLEGGEDDL